MVHSFKIGGVGRDFRGRNVLEQEDFERLPEQRVGLEVLPERCALACKLALNTAEKHFEGGHLEGTSVHLVGVVFSVATGWNPLELDTASKPGRVRRSKPYTGMTRPGRIVFRCARSMHTTT